MTRNCVLVTRVKDDHSLVSEDSISFGSLPTVITSAPFRSHYDWVLEIDERNIGIAL